MNKNTLLKFKENQIKLHFPKKILSWPKNISQLYSDTYLWQIKYNKNVQNPPDHQIVFFFLFIFLACAFGLASIVALW